MIIPKAFCAPVNSGDLESKMLTNISDLHRQRQKLVQFENAGEWDKLLIEAQTYTNMVAKTGDLWDALQIAKLREKGLIE